MNPHDPPTPDAQPSLLLVEAAAVVDADRVQASPGAVLLRIDRGGIEVLMAGEPGLVRAHPLSSDAEHWTMPNRVLIPALVNAHTHLDLTHIGPQAFAPERGFVGWVDEIRASRASDERALRASVLDGIRRLIAGGVGAVGDIAGVGSLVPTRVLAGSDLRGVSFIEMFGVGARQDDSIEAMARALDAASVFATDRVRAGVQPHAPYSAGLRLYHAATERSDGATPFATHLAETPEEVEFVRSGAGPQRDLLERLGVWDDSVLDEVGFGQRPVEHLEPVLKRARSLVAHLNAASDCDLDVLQAVSTTVAYCPRCSSYFSRESDFGAHRYREMLRRGIRVAIGTDSVINLPKETAHRLSPLDEMRLLLERDGTEARTLLAMATTHGLHGLGMDESLGRLEGRVLGLLALEGATLEEAIALAGDISWVGWTPREDRA